MALTDGELKRLSQLTEEFCSAALIAELYQIDLLNNGPLWQRYQSWLRRTRARSFAGDETQERVNRHWLEIFFQRERILPTYLAAARLGMTRDSFVELHAGLATIGVEDLEFERDQDIVGESFLQSIASAFPSTRRRTFDGHDDYCRRMHEAIKIEFKFEVAPLFCAVAAVLGEQLYAYEFDTISCTPLSLPYQVWLDTGKPMSLKPDMCGIDTYVRGEASLSKMAFGGHPPHQLDPQNNVDLRKLLVA